MEVVKGIKKGAVTNTKNSLRLSILVRQDGQRKGEAEPASLAQFACHADCAPVVLDDLLADGKPQSRAFGLVGERVAHLPELLKDHCMLLWRDADPGVRDRELDKARADEPCFAAYRTARSEFHGIRYQVDQHLHDLAAIGPDSGQARLHIRLEVEVLTAVQRCCSVACLRK